MNEPLYLTIYITIIMMKKVAAVFIVCQVAFAFTHRQAPGAHSSISLSSLLDEMADRDSPSYFPEPSFDLFQASSWDRAELGGKNSPGWFANKDYDNYIRKETNGKRTEYVIMEAQGPGAITKWWFPQLDFLTNRVVRIYLDNNPDPVIAENYKQLIVGQSFVKWPFAFISSDEKDAAFQYSMPVGFPKQVGADFYLPIPFATSCKVTLDDSVFYLISIIGSTRPAPRSLLSVKRTTIIKASLLIPPRKNCWLLILR
jgi:hypothetical protein